MLLQFFLNNLFQHYVIFCGWGVLLNAVPLCVHRLAMEFPDLVVKFYNSYKNPIIIVHIIFGYHF